MNMQSSITIFDGVSDYEIDLARVVAIRTNRAGGTVKVYTDGAHTLEFTEKAGKEFTRVYMMWRREQLKKSCSLTSTPLEAIQMYNSGRTQ